MDRAKPAALSRLGDKPHQQQRAAPLPLLLGRHFRAAFGRDGPLVLLLVLRLMVEQARVDAAAAHTRGQLVGLAGLGPA